MYGRQEVWANGWPARHGEGPNCKFCNKFLSLVVAASALHGHGNRREPLMYDGYEAVAPTMWLVGDVVRCAQ